MDKNISKLDEEFLLADTQVTWIGSWLDVLLNKGRKKMEVFVHMELIYLRS